ncbi:MAG: hypothetical protein M1816_004091 [Peltula sp. TS41687]|nr:MAG: hypothetical protein M1816_004091 [Peltula sp. TS41687]
MAPLVPEIIEERIFNIVDSRTEVLNTLRELGPPDLVLLVKQTVKSPSKRTGVYHHVSGIDASSSASLAAYVNTLTYMPHEKSQKVISGIYCCYNAFSRLDMRVQVTIPGSVESYCIDDRGLRHEATENLWLETYLCAVLRAYSYADDGGGDMIKSILGMRRFNPITNTESEHKFLDAAERLFFKGWLLGSDSEIQLPTVVSNHLTSGLLNYIRTTGRYTSGMNLFEKLRTRDVEIASLLARVLISADEEVRAVALLHETIQQLPMDHNLLDVQASFCLNKGRGDLALECAKRSVIAAPGEFGPWIQLAEIYVSLEEWGLALLTLNSCPMYTHQDKDLPRMPDNSSRVTLPISPDSLLDEMNEDVIVHYDHVHPSVRKLMAFNYKGTFSKAYSLLSEITARIGWDQLLRLRSEVFVMEEEYRSQTRNRRSSSTTAMKTTSNPSVNGAVTESPGGAKQEPIANGNHAESPSSPTETTAIGSENSRADGLIEKPEHTVTSEEVKGGGGDDHEPGTQFEQFQEKRLCERWLDNLFMVLYEDLRVYTIWRSEMSQYKEESIQYKKSADEWELLGALAERLHHPEEAIEAYEQCLQIRFSPRAMKAILGRHEREGDVKMMLATIIRLVNYQHRWYSEFSPALLYTIRKLIEEEGALKVRNIIQATSLPQPVLDLSHNYADLCATFRSSGTDI